MSYDAPIVTLVDKAGAVVTTIADSSAQRLQVQTQSDGQAIATPANSIKSNLLYSSSANLMVNGGTTAAQFKFSASATRGITITQILTILSNGQITTNGGYFGSFSAALTNGLLYGVTQSSVTNNLATVKINEDFVAMSGKDCFDVAGAYAYGFATLSCYAPLVAGSTDCVSITVRDNLTATGIFGTKPFSYLVAYAVGYYTS